MISTTRSQSARLIACGVDPKTADMCWCKVKSPCREGFTWVLVSENYLKRRESDEFIPAWSLSALLELLPKKIQVGYDKEAYSFEISYNHTFNDAPWTIKYGDNRYYNSEIFLSKSPIEACVKAIEWLTQNGFTLAHEANSASNKNEKK